jgi:hypothetical protein
MKEAVQGITVLAAAALLAGTAWAQSAKPLKRCAPDAVIAGTVCMDTYEASVWRVPGPTTINKGLVKKIQQGKATAADLTAGGATQLGIGFTDNYVCRQRAELHRRHLRGEPARGPAVGESHLVPGAGGVRERAQAAAVERRMAGGGDRTPDPGPDNGSTDCNTASVFVAVATGSRSSCKSARGAFDMVGNLYEWVADWVPRSTACGTWSAGVSPTGDDQCLAGAATTGEPGALRRGGDLYGPDLLVGTLSGPLTVDGRLGPSGASDGTGFRCAR